MTVIAQNVSVTYAGTGSVGPFGFNFPISSPAALKVIQNNAVLAPTAYTITPVNNNYDNGGSVTLVAACPVGQTLVLQRSTPLTQASVFNDNLPQPMQQFEDALDKLTEIDQELAASIAAIVTPAPNSTYVVAGPGINVTGVGTLTNPYIISLSTGLTITAFMGYQLVEVGTPIVNPTFTATYTGSPTSANITNTDNISSPWALGTPFTSATITGTFTSSAPHTTTFTLTASDGVRTVTATQSLDSQWRIFAGLGSGGVTGATASGTTAVLNTGDVLPSVQLGAESIGLSVNLNPVGQYIYLFLTQPGHTFVDANTGFPFAIDAPFLVHFVNAHGVTVSMYMYRSTNPLSGNFQPKVVT